MIKYLRKIGRLSAECEEAYLLNESEDRDLAHWMEQEADEAGYEYYLWVGLDPAFFSLLLRSN